MTSPLFCPYSTETAISTNCHKLINFRIREDSWNFAIVLSKSCRSTILLRYRYDRLTNIRGIRLESLKCCQEFTVKDTGGLEGHGPAVPRPVECSQAVCSTTTKAVSPWCCWLLLLGADYKFIWIDTDGEDHQSDGQLFGASELKECIDDNTINLPDNDPLPNDDRDTPYYILGDDAFPLRTFPMKPYCRRGLDNDMMVANYIISRGRRVVENGFGILANRWSCFIHILLRIRFPAIANAEVDRENEDHNIIPGAWRGDQQVEEIPQPQAPHRDNRVGKVMRDYLKAYFNSEAGSVPWQERLAGIDVN